MIIHAGSHFSINKTSKYYNNNHNTSDLKENVASTDNSVSKDNEILKGNVALKDNLALKVNVSSKDNLTSKKQVYDYLKEKMKNILDPTNGMSEEEKAAYDEKTNQKIKNGEKLSESEMRYLQAKSPYMYALISRVQMQRQALEDRLKNCRSKKEVEEVYNDSMLHIDKDDPARVPLQSAYNNVTQEFKESSIYKNLPQKTDKRDKSSATNIPLTEEAANWSKYLLKEDVNNVIDYKA